MAETFIKQYQSTYIEPAIEQAQNPSERQEWLLSRWGNSRVIQMIENVFAQAETFLLRFL